MKNFLIKYNKLSAVIMLLMGVSIWGSVVYAASITARFPGGLNSFAEGDVIEEEDWNAIEKDLGTHIGNVASGTPETLNWIVRNARFATSALQIGLSATTTISSTATSTFQKGISISGGCFEMPSGTCLTSGASLLTTANTWTASQFFNASTTVTPTLNLGSYLIASSTFATLGNLWTTASTTIQGVLNVSGASTLQGGATINGTLTLGTPLSDANVANDITLTNITQITNRAITDLTGTLTISNGGTGATTFTSNGVLYGNGTGAFQVTAAPGQEMILAGSAGVPLFTGGATTTHLNITGSTTISSLNVGGTATNTFQSGINLTTGCFATNGTCVGGGGTPGGSNRQVQFNNSSVFGGATNLVYDSNGNVGVGTTTVGGGVSLGVQGGAIITGTTTIGALEATTTIRSKGFPYWALLGRTVMSAATTSMMVRNIPPTNTLRIVIGVLGRSAAVQESVVVFNEDLATNYGYNDSVDFGVLAGANNGVNFIDLKHATAQPVSSWLEFTNNSDTRKLGFGESIIANATGANAPSSKEHMMVWNNTTAQINTVEFRSNRTETFTAGSFLEIYGLREQ